MMTGERMIWLEKELSILINCIRTLTELKISMLTLFVMARVLVGFWSQWSIKDNPWDKTLAMEINSKVDGDSNSKDGEGSKVDGDNSHQTKEVGEDNKEDGDSNRPCKVDGEANSKEVGANNLQIKVDGAISHQIKAGETKEATDKTTAGEILNDPYFFKLE